MDPCAPYILSRADNPFESYFGPAAVHPSVDDDGVEEMQEGDDVEEEAFQFAVPTSVYRPNQDDDEGNDMDQGDDDNDGLVLLSAEHGVSIGPDGTLYARPASTPEEEQESERLYRQYLASQGIHDNDDDSDGDMFEPLPIVHDGLRMEKAEWQEAREDHDREHNAISLVSAARGKRRAAPVRTFLCHYVGCRASVAGESLLCPHPDSYVNPSIPDMEYEFCSYKCMDAWALYEVGEPVSLILHQLIERRAGGTVVPMPPPCETLANQMGAMMGARHNDASLIFTEEEIASRGAAVAQQEERHARGKGHKMV